MYKLIDSIIIALVYIKGKEWSKSNPVLKVLI